MGDSKVIRKGSCDRCGSSDANVLYEGGTKFCFSCRTYSKGEDMEQVQKTVSINSNHQNFSSGVVDGIPDRAIKKETANFYNVQVYTIEIVMWLSIFILIMISIIAT